MKLMFISRPLVQLIPTLPLVMSKRHYIRDQIVLSIVSVLSMTPRWFVIIHGSIMQMSGDDMLGSEIHESLIGLKQQGDKAAYMYCRDS